ncbi:hypothetical protein O9993_15185 [Vibrio lentus]|nr:hypothetical protein [Vibrio lentus]
MDIHGRSTSTWVGAAALTASDTEQVLSESSMDSVMNWERRS